MPFVASCKGEPLYIPPDLSLDKETNYKTINLVRDENECSNNSSQLTIKYMDSEKIDPDIAKKPILLMAPKKNNSVEFITEKMIPGEPCYIKSVKSEDRKVYPKFSSKFRQTFLYINPYGGNQPPSPRLMAQFESPLSSSYNSSVPSRESSPTFSEGSSRGKVKDDYGKVKDDYDKVKDSSAVKNWLRPFGIFSRPIMAVKSNSSAK